MSKNKTRIFLHIGRNKAGSTSLQDFFFAQRAQFAAVGLCYRPFGHLMKLTPNEPGFATHFELVEYARSNSYNTYLVSNEIMSLWAREYTESLIADLVDFDVKVIVYLRPYGDWVCSDYSQAVRGGLTKQDFDTYVEQIQPRISVWPNLEGWGEALGWDRLRIRSLHPRDLVNGDLISDFLSAIGRDVAFATGVKRSNQTLHWTVLETLRALVEVDSDIVWHKADSLIAVKLGGLMEQCLTLHPTAPTGYLTIEQAQQLADLYNRDLGRIAERTGTQLQPEIPTGSERAMLPSFDHIPLPLLRDWATRASAPTFRADHPEAADVAERLIAGRSWIFG